MRTIEYRTAHVPAFLTKLWKLVTDPNSDDLISWNVNGTSFIIYDEIRFAKELLPMYFKHNNMASFVRQLNMYGFRKLSCIDQGGMHTTKHEIEFYHQYFIKNQESLLDLIKRKIPSNRTCDDPKVKPAYVKELINNVKTLQAKQQNAEKGMDDLRQENKVLFQQLTMLNSRYIKQQAMLQQVLPLFVNMMHSSQRLALKRRTPLMIDDGEVKEKARRIEQQPYFVENEDSNISSRLTHSPGNVSNRGPVITEMESSKMFADNILCSPNTTKEHDVIVDSPLSSLESPDRNSPYTDGEGMEPPLNILNCNFESMPSMAASRLPSPINITNSELLGRNITVASLNHQAGNLNALANLQAASSIESRKCTTSPIRSPTLNVNTSYKTKSSRSNMQRSFTTVVIDETSNHESPVASKVSFPSPTLLKSPHQSFPSALLDESANHGSPITTNLNPIISYPSSTSLNNVPKQFTTGLVDESSNHASPVVTAVDPAIPYPISDTLKREIAQKQFLANLIDESINRSTSPMSTALSYSSPVPGGSSQKAFPINLLDGAINHGSSMSPTALKTNLPFPSPATENTVPKSFPTILLDQASNNGLPTTNTTTTPGTPYQPNSTGNLLKTLPSVPEELSNQTNLPSDAIARIENALGWMPSGNENEENFNKWLGQLVRADNLVVGASLPAHNVLGQNSTP